MLLTQQLCVAAISSPYSLLPRAHTYALIAALIVPLPRGWLFRAALAAFTARTAIFTIDAAVILHAVSKTTESGTEPIPLDALMALEAVGLAVIVACWLLLVSTRAAESSARTLIRIWALIVTVGSILSFVSVARLGRLVAAGYWGAAPDEHCEGIWMDGSTVFGTPQSIRAIGLIGSELAWLVQRVGIPPLVFSPIAIVAIAIPKKRTVAFQQAGGEINSGDIWKDEPDTQKRLGMVKTIATLLISTALLAMAILMVVSTEQYLHTGSSGFPSVEKMTSVGQWGVWAATGAVVLATLVNAITEKNGLGKAVSTKHLREGSEITRL